MNKPQVKTGSTLSKMAAPTVETAKPQGTQADHHVTDHTNHTTTLKGNAAIAEYQREVSPQGVKQAAAGANKALDKKYPGLYKK